MAGFDFDAHTNRLLNDHLDAQDAHECPVCGDLCVADDPSGCVCSCYEPDPDRFRDEDPADIDREDY